MATTLSVQILTNEGQLVADEAVSIQAPGALGYLGILLNHAPLVTLLQPGKLSWRRHNGEPRAWRISAGLLEVAHNQVTVLTDRATPAKPEEPAGPIQ